MDVMRILSLQVGAVRTVGQADAANAAEQAWTTGLFKSSVSEPVWLGATGLAGDQQADLRNHGGPHKAVNVYPAEHYAFWREQLQLPELGAGAFGENFTTEGALEADVCIGDVCTVGGATVQVSQPRQPCWKLARRWRVSDLDARIRDTGRTGWYLRVLAAGYVAANSTLCLIGRPYPEWTVARVNALIRRRKSDPDAAAELSRCPLPH